MDERRGSHGWDEEERSGARGRRCAWSHRARTPETQRDGASAPNATVARSTGATFEGSGSERWEVKGDFGQTLGGQKPSAVLCLMIR